MNRSRRRVSLLPVATLYSICIATVVPYNSAADTNSMIHSRLRNGFTNELPSALENQKSQIVSKRRSTAIDMSSFNDDTTLEEVEELMEEDNESDDDDMGSIPTLANNTRNDDGVDGLLDEILDDLTEAFANVTNTTSEELFENMIDTFFGPSDDDSNTNSTTSIDDVFEDVMTSIFGTVDDDDDDVTVANKTVPEVLDMQIDSPLKTQEDVRTTNFKDTYNPPLPPDVTSNNSTNNIKDIHTDNNDEPESPGLETTYPTTAPQHRPTSLPTESPTSERIDDFDLKDKETEKEDDDLFDEKSYHNKSRPVGSGVPSDKFSFTVVLGTFAAIIGMIFTAWQMSDNPDGIYASLCRLTLTCIQLVFRIIMSPCRKCCGGYHNHHHMAGSNGYHEPYGHLPVSTMDYGYKDPTLELT